MGWERRKGKRYFYAARRENGRVVKKYLGAGPDVVKAAAHDQERRRLRRQALVRQRRLESQLAKLTGCIEPFWQASKQLLDLALDAHGYHCHRGEWRQRRATV